MSTSKFNILGCLRNREKGFTLIELVIVVMIVVIISSFAIPVFIKYKAKTMKTEARSLLSGIWNHETVYFSSNHDRYSESNSEMGFNPITDPKFYKNWYINVYEDVAGHSRFVATCSGNLDKDVFMDVWRLTDSSRGAINTFDDVEDIEYIIP